MEEKDRKSRSYRDLDVWNLAITLVKQVYLVTERLPTSEIYGLTNQIRRAAISIPSNIAEGQSGQSAKEFRQYLAIGLGSLGELETQLIIAKEIDYLRADELNLLLNQIGIIRKMIKSLSNSLK